MQDKLIKLLNIKIDAINKNIDNLNYLNDELKNNEENLNYIKNMIDIFKDDDVVNFDAIDKNDFDKILSMINPIVTEIFQEKTCNYHGIMYIIQGIRQGISLELTSAQTSAVLAFIDGMKEKKEELDLEVANLNKNKERLPETDLEILLKDLEVYNSIISKIEDNLYLVEIDSVVDVLDFSNVSLEEKIAIFEFILRYNANIYLNSKENKEIEIEESNSLDEIKIPEFHFEPVNIELESNEASFSESQEKLNEEKKEELDVFSNNVTNLNEYGTMQMPIITANDHIVIQNDENNEIKSELDNIEIENTNTVDLEEIIKKIDAKLKEMEEQDKLEMDQDSASLESYEVPISSNNDLKGIALDELTLEDDMIDDEVTNTAIKEVFSKYDIESLIEKEEIKNKKINAFELDSILSLLKDFDILEILKNKEEIFSKIIISVSKEKLDLVLTGIKENLVSKKEKCSDILLLIIETMPLLLCDTKTMDSFIQNIEFYKKHNINLINLFAYYRELLILDNQILINNYLKIKDYEIALTNDNVKYLLYNSHILENLDFYIEAMGQEKGFLGKEEKFDGIEYINKHPYKLNNISRDVLMKLRYSTENEQKIYGSKPGILAGEIANSKVDILNLSDEYKNLYFNNEYGFLDRSEMISLLEEIKDIKDFNMNIDNNLLKLDSLYKENELRYNIENIYISRIKTIRIYNCLLTKNMNEKNALLIALTYNSVIKVDEYAKIENIVNSLIEGGN